MKKQFHSAYGVFSLARLPEGDKTLFAWDAADELLLSYLGEQGVSSESAHTAIVNDSFGAISCALKGQKRDSLSDSLIAHLAAAENFNNNAISVADNGLYQAIKSSDKLSNSYDLVIIKIPKALALLEDQLISLKACIAPSCVIIAAGMTRNIHKSTLELFEQIIGPTHTSLAKKKARLIFAENRSQSYSENDVRNYQQHKRISRYKLEGSDFVLVNLPGVFSRSKLDIGTRFFLPHIKNMGDSEFDILDLGCGNGALGIMAAVKNLNARITFIDESYQALESVKMALESSIGMDEERFSLQVNHVLEGVNEPKYDLILCNPPFHQNNSIGKQTAFLMFRQAKNVLKNGGKIQVVANRHLQYQHKLKQLFNNCTLVDSNSKFVILESEKK